jgi:exopolysaccharide biosynthesis polyprenyl glycosylphosphotransferase
LVLASPVMLLAALAIKLDSRGPVFYRQERVGLGGRSFYCVKFRSMRTDAESDGVARWAAKNDSRVTRVGAFMRKTRIDELPQLITVLKGEMSIVGPRPERPEFVAQLSEQIPFYHLRHGVKPGVTGWAQVRYTYGASVEDARKKHQFDLYYLKNNSIWLDLQILVETVTVVMFREGAH